jgi:hypothetical protein
VDRNVALGTPGNRVHVLVAASIPLAWPVYIAIGWYESGLAFRMRTGDDTARASAVRLLYVQAVAFFVVSVTAAVVAGQYRDAVGAGYISLAWVPLAAIAVLHVRTARALTP